MIIEENIEKIKEILVIIRNEVSDYNFYLKGGFALNLLLSEKS